jgi:hypothetical protein
VTLRWDERAWDIYEQVGPLSRRPRKPWSRQLRWSAVGAYLLVAVVAHITARMMGLTGWQEIPWMVMGLLVVLSLVGGGQR